MRAFKLKQKLRDVLTDEEAESIESSIERVSATLDASARQPMTILETALIEPKQELELCDP